MSSGNVDLALVGKLAGDATLTTLAPGGVWREVAPQGVAEPYVVVQLMGHQDTYELNRAQAFEDCTYMVKAVQQANSGAAVQAVADRVQALLQNGTLTITGYRLVTMMRLERIAYVEIDEDRDRRYQHRGGLYRVLVEPT
jgi:hypothetical protein